MEIFSEKFILLFIVAIILMTLWARKNKPLGKLREKQISITGKRLTTFLSKETPLTCLMDDGRNFGEGFQDKEVPQLPHSEDCRCQLNEIIHRSQELFSNKKTELKTQPSDLGELEQADSRYYRYTLIGHHQNASPQLTEEYLDLARNIEISDQFKVQVENHLNIEVLH
ncbi:MAG: hypothetical protein GY866_14070 [Proteobacteria bacterium]|nr:hypothetical protein [Pseudomonadota bacterium]